MGALANLGYKVCDQTVGNVLQRHGLPPAPERKRTTTWSAFIRIHLALLAGTDFFTAEVLTLRGLVTYYVLFFIHLESRRVDIAGITVHPDERWMQQMAITKGRAMSCCSLAVQTPAATGLFNAASDWAACCVITIRKQRNGVPKNNAHKGREAGATYAGAYTGAGRVAASISAPRKTGPCPAAVPIMRRGWMASFGKRVAAARTRLP
jgi:hypothetical protein